MVEKKELGTSTLAVIIILLMALIVFLALLINGNTSIKSITTKIKYSSIPSVVINDIRTISKFMDYKKSLDCKIFKKLVMDNNYTCTEKKDNGSIAMTISKDKLINYSISKTRALNVERTVSNRTEYDLTISYRNAKKYDKDYAYKINEKIIEFLKDSLHIKNRDISNDDFYKSLTISNFSRKLNKEEEYGN